MSVNRLPIYDRGRLGRVDRLSGPAIVEEPAATTLVGPGQELEVDDLGNLVISLPAAGSEQARNQE